MISFQNDNFKNEEMKPHKTENIINVSDVRKTLSDGDSSKLKNDLESIKSKAHLAAIREVKEKLKTLDSLERIDHIIIEYERKLAGVLRLSTIF